MIVVPDYRGFRIEVNAVAIDGRYNADSGRSGIGFPWCSTSASHTSRRDTKGRRVDDGDCVAWHGLVARRAVGRELDCPPFLFAAQLHRD